MEKGLLEIVQYIVELSGDNIRNARQSQSVIDIDDLMSDEFDADIDLVLVSFDAETVLRIVC